MKKKASSKVDYCCIMMETNVSDSFDEKGRIKYDDPHVVMNRWKNGTYGIPIHDGGTSLIVIKYCPWCGLQLPKPKKK